MNFVTLEKYFGCLRDNRFVSHKMELWEMLYLGCSITSGFVLIIMIGKSIIYQIQTYFLYLVPLLSLNNKINSLFSNKCQKLPSLWFHWSVCWSVAISVHISTLHVAANYIHGPHVDRQLKLPITLPVLRPYNRGPTNPTRMES